MEETIWEHVQDFFEGAVFVYGTTLLVVYALLAIMSLIAITRFKRREKNIDDEKMLGSPIAPGISVIAPAFNEGLTIIGNVRSLLTLNYPHFEIIIVNDGSSDDTLEQMIVEFELVKVDFAFSARIKTQPVRGVYKSTNSAYSKLLVIDKVNGKSKADAVNAAINIATFNYFLCTDVDCILEKNTLLKLIKPVMSEEKKRVIATGATLRMVNSCDVDEGVITRVRPPRQILPRFQEMEYLRAFVLGKMGWSWINCVPNVSGGLGLFDKEVAIKAGGYDHKSFGEDMELMTRMVRYAYDNKIDYAIRYIPITLCWTEGPSTVKIFMRQRTRWSRGLSQLMFAHIKMLFNPRYGRMGLIVFPYNFFFELLAPIIEFLGVIYYIVLICLGMINWHFAILLLIFVYTYSIMISTTAILWDQITFRYYKSWKEVASLCVMPFYEMILYHPMIMVFALRGYYYFLTGKKHTWGNMQRKGFNTTAAKMATANNNNTQAVK
ncbi:MAG: glycosyltransferase family 2 protein [Filimonas sp.]|nr:glycosyltransferase family 2 protein [Filimonas sp.]